MMPTNSALTAPLAADYEIKNVKICVVDYDHSPYSNKLINKITASGYFTLVDYSDSYEKALRFIEHDEADLVLQVPRSFEKNLVREDAATLFMALNAINGVKQI